MIYVPVHLVKLSPYFVRFEGGLEDHTKLFEGEVKDHLLGLPALVNEHAGGQEQIAYTDMDTEKVREPQVTASLNLFVDSDNVLLPVADIAALGADLTEDGLRDRGGVFRSSIHSII